MCWKCFDCFRAHVEDVQLLDYQHCMLNDVPVEVFTYERTLEELYLQSNRIRDLPRPLFHCHGLKTLSLSDNDILNLPPAIASLINLRRLDLSKNALCGIPDNIKCCKQLFWIDVSVNPLEKLPEGFTQLINLEELYLNDTYLDFLPANFGRLTKLKILELRENNLNTLPKSIARLSHLERLDIGQNEFSDLLLRERIFPEVIGSLINLTELWIDCNRIRSIPAFIGNLKKLIHFDATNNSIDWIAPEIEKCKKMVDFTVSYNELQTIPSTIGHLEELITLKLDDNQLNLLPNTIGKLSKLEEMILSQNDLEALPKSIGLLRKLRVLNVDDNMLEELPPEIGSCSNLTIISVRNNKLQEVPAELGHLPSIRMINLSENLLCNLPVSILKLSHLTALWLSNNQNTPLVTLHKEIDKETRQTVCVNFMLPQTIQDRYVALPKGTANNSNEEHTPRSHPHIWFATETTEDKSCGLLRAPTPYPKELRAMSKHVRNLQQSSKRASREVDEVVPLLGELVSPESSDVQIKEAKVKKPTNITISKNSITWQNNATASSRPSENASGDRPIIREAKFVRHINSSSLLQHAEKVNLIEPTSLQSQLLVVDSEYFKNQRLNIEPKTEQPLQPPPYHIAAAYSKQAIWFEHPPNCAKNSKLLRVPSSSESLHKAYVVGESK